MAILDLIQQGTEAAKKYAQLGSPVYNFAKGLAIGPSEAYISDTMRDQLVQKAKETELDKGSLGYEAFGLPVATEGGRFTGGLFDLAIKDPVAFGNVGSVGRVSFEKDPTAPGGYRFGDTKFDFTPDKDTGSTGNPILDFINQGGFRSTSVGKTVYDLGGKIADLNLGFTSAAAAEPLSSQKFSQQYDQEATTGGINQILSPEEQLRLYLEEEGGEIDREYGEKKGLGELLESLSGGVVDFGKDIASRAIMSEALSKAGRTLGGIPLALAGKLTGLFKGGDMFKQSYDPFYKQFADPSQRGAGFKDRYGINTASAFGDYGKYALNKAYGVNALRGDKGDFYRDVIAKKNAAMTDANIGFEDRGSDSGSSQSSGRESAVEQEQSNRDAARGRF